MPVVADIGSGLLAPHPLLPDEPDAATTLAEGAAVVTASGDKLLGGPQAGLLLGTAETVQRLRRHPLARALRVDKLTLAALQATLEAGATPTWQALEADPDVLRERCAALADAVGGKVVASDGTVGGGGAPGHVLPGWAVALPPEVGPALRTGRPPVIARIDRDRCLVDLRCIHPADDALVRAAVARRRRARGLSRMYVLATAGHVDHGKSTLVHALTGMEPDRWQEEKRRGLTIDLGYAWTTLPDGDELAFVDVPGHERFIANMLAGLGPAPGVLFVVAADSGWAAQSREHLAAVDALGLRHGLLVVTRSDLADPAPALAEARAELARSSLGEVPAVAVSAAAGAGLAELRERLVELCAGHAHPGSATRGCGCGSTGSSPCAAAARSSPARSRSGTVRIGDTLLLGDRDVVVRSIQSLGRDRAQVSGVARVALNLRGVSHEDVARGDVLLGPGEWHRTRVLDVRMRAVDDAERLPARLVLHVGTHAAPVHVRPLGPDTARLTLPRDLPLLAGDRAVLRDPGRHAVVAGVEVLDADPPQLRRRGAARDRGQALADGRPDAYHEIARRGAVPREHLTALGIEIPERPDLHQHAGWVVTEGVWRDWQAAASDAVVQWAAQHPLDPAMPRAALIQRLGLPDDRMLDPVLAAAGLAGGGGRVAAPLAVTLGPAEAAVRAGREPAVREPVPGA